jgi:hypothetical protein
VNYPSSTKYEGNFIQPEEGQSPLYTNRTAFLLQKFVEISCFKCARRHVRMPPLGAELKDSFIKQKLFTRPNNERLPVDPKTDAYSQSSAFGTIGEDLELGNILRLCSPSTEI